MIAAWMVYATVVGVLLGVAALVVERGLRMVGWATRGAWVGASVFSIVFVVVAYVTIPGGAPAGAGRGPSPTGPTAPIGVGIDPMGIDAMSRWVIDVPAWWSTLDVPLIVLWAFASLSLVALFVFIAVRIRRDARSWPERQIEGHSVRVSPDLGPGVLGLLRPSVVMPAWTGELDAISSRMIVTHELEHVRARDTWLSHFALLLAALMPWNVALWWHARRLRDAIETDCDRRVLARGIDRHAYGELLVRVCERTVRPRILIAAMSEPRSRLGRRIALMTASSVNRFKWPVVLGMGAVTVALVVASCETPTPPSQIGDTDLATSDTVLVRVERLPERISGPSPRYPTMLRQAGVEGNVVLSFVVLEDGTVDETSIEIVESTNRAFEKPSHQVIAASRFRPAIVDGSPVAMRIEQSISFSISGEKREPGTDLQSADMPGDGGEPIVFEVLGIEQNQALFLIDGAVASKEAIARLDRDRIERVEVIRSDAAVARFGEGARRGVVAVFTKDGTTR